MANLTYTMEISQKRQNQACVVHFLAELSKDDVGLLVRLVAKQQLLHVCQLPGEIFLSLEI